jgi:peptidoglycan/LPS O-acetylase OafA/YrhL
MGGRTAIPLRFYSLDVLRGVAALCVVFWHWQHFFYVGAELAPSFLASKQPLFGSLSLLYGYGWLAVDLFFSLSGFIFYWLYSIQVSSRAMRERDFLVLRFSRLYPLHLLTLLWVAILQFVFSRMTGSFFDWPR